LGWGIHHTNAVNNADQSSKRCGSQPIFFEEGTMQIGGGCPGRGEGLTKLRHVACWHNMFSKPQPRRTLPGGEYFPPRQRPISIAA